MDITFTISSRDTELIERITRIIEHREIEHKEYEVKRIAGCCSTCPYWRSANEDNSRGTRVKWGRCARYQNAARNEADKWCSTYLQEVQND